jgi:cell filamentation protein, protein adenylyltransferase
MYDAVDDPYCYAGTDILKNVPGLREHKALEAFETIAVAMRFEDPLPRGRLGTTHYRAVHRHLFRDVFRWAGRYRTVWIVKGDSTFCHPAHIDRQMRSLFRGLRQRGFLRSRGVEDFAAGSAHFLAELNAIHPFREGNGRAQFAFLMTLAREAGHLVNPAPLAPSAFREAMIASFRGDEAPLAREIWNLVR